MAPAVCRNHFELPAAGICMRCKDALCAACITKVDGVNHCTDCLRLPLTRRPAARALPGWLSLALTGGLLWLLLWRSLETLFPGGSAP